MPACASEPIKAYCDFENDAMYHYYGQTSEEKPNDLHHLHSIEGIRHLCSKKGLFPLEFKNKEMVINVIGFIRDL